MRQVSTASNGWSNCSISAIRIDLRQPSRGSRDDIFAVSTFDLQFSYVLAGWEGSAHDALVLKDAVSYHGLRLPPGKYLLADAGYSNTEHTLVPFRGTRYHLKEQRLEKGKIYSCVIEYIGNGLTEAKKEDITFKFPTAIYGVSKCGLNP